MTSDLVPITSTPAELTNADFTISPATRERIYNAFATNTQRAYKRLGETWFAWCAGHGRRPLPATEETLTEFVNQLADSGLGPSSLEQAISAVRTIHKHAGHKGQPSADGARLVVRSVRKEGAERGERIREAPPLSVGDLQLMIDVTEPDTLIGKRDRAMLVTGLAMMSRRSELTELLIPDFREVAEGWEILIRKSKTDQDAKGEIVAIPRGTTDETDPVRVVRAWFDELGRHGVHDGPFLRSVTRWGTLHPAGSMSTDHVNRRVKLLARLAGLPDAGLYTAHSLRAGGLTESLRSGASLSQAARHGRWNLKSPVVLRYDRAVSRWRNNPMRKIGL